MTSRTVGPRLRNIDKIKKTTVVWFLVSTVLSPCMSAPVSSAILARRAARNIDSGAWWHQPCGHTKPERSVRLRHTSHESYHTKTVLTALNNFRSQFNTTINKIENFYTGELSCKKFDKEQLDIEWRPKIPRGAERRKLLLRKHRLMALEKFHRDIQVYAVAIYEMTKFPVPPLADFNESARHEILGNVVENTQQVFCELESLIAEIKKQASPGLLKMEKDDLKPWFAKGDGSLTDLCTTDWAILSAYSEFMRQWRMIMRQVIRPKDNSSTDGDEGGY